MFHRLIVKSPLLLVAVSLVLGIVLADHISLAVPLLPVLAGGVVVSVLLWRHAQLQSAAILVCFLLFGMMLMQRHLSSPADSLIDSPQVERSRAFFLQQREVLLQRFSAHGIDGDVYAVVAAMSLGDKTALTHDVKEVYAVSGASHVLALSGLHLGVVYMLLSLLLSRRRWPMLSQVVILLGVWAFVLLVGMPVSVVRSAVMLSVYSILSIGHRNRMSLNALAFTAIVLLLFNPSWLYDVGFQMSFMAVLAILLFMPLFESVFSAQYLMEHPWVRRLWSLIAVSCSAQLGVAPLIAFYFGRFSTCFLLTNLVAVPAAVAILWLSLVVLLIPSLAYLLLYIVRFLYVALLHISTLPGSSISGLHPTVGQVVLVYVLIFCVYLFIGRIIPMRVLRASR